MAYSSGYLILLLIFPDEKGHTINAVKILFLKGRM